MLKYVLCACMECIDTLCEQSIMSKCGQTLDRMYSENDMKLKWSQETTVMVKGKPDQVHTVGVKLVKNDPNENNDDSGPAFVVTGSPATTSTSNRGNNGGSNNEQCRVVL